MEVKTETSPNSEAKNQSAAPPQDAKEQDETNARLQAILDRARQGDKSVLPDLKAILDDNPCLWQESYRLVSLVEQGWLDKISDKNLLLSQSIRRQVEAMKKDLAGASPTPLEQLLSERIVAAWLAVQHADLSDSTNDPSGSKVAEMRLKRVESASRRFLAATKALAVVRRLTNGLKIEIRHVDRQAADTSEPAAVSRNNAGRSVNAPAGADKDAVHERLRDFFEQDAAQVHAVVAER
jgi:hypothetical protein